MPVKEYFHETFLIPLEFFEYVVKKYRFYPNLGPTSIGERVKNLAYENRYAIDLFIRKSIEMCLGDINS